MDTAASKTFYCEGLGFSEVAQLELTPSEPLNTLLELSPAHIFAEFIERDGLRIELLYYKSPGHEPVHHKKMNQTGITHLSFRVQNLDEAILSIQTVGGTYLSQTCFDNPPYRSKGCFMLDPNGVRIELLEAPGDPHLLPGQRPKKN
jgi:catechol 2,3-dioxygenase-like lactoylglutathione lyase family enzyme